MGGATGGPRDRVVILDAAPMGRPLAEALSAAGVEVERIDLAREAIVGLRGQQKLRGIDVRASDGSERTVAGTLIAVAALPAPASELPRQHGAAVSFDAARGGFVAEIDDGFATSAPACSRAAT